MLAKIVNLALLGLYPLAWQAPLLNPTVAWFFSAGQITIFSGIQALWDKDVVLCVIVTAFAVVAPYLKTVAMVYAQFSDAETARRMVPILEFLGRFSMIDVFLVALYILTYRGMSSIHIQWGLYLFSGLVVASIWAGWATWRQRFRTVPTDFTQPRMPMSVGVLVDPAARPKQLPHHPPAGAPREEAG